MFRQAPNPHAKGGILTSAEPKYGKITMVEITSTVGGKLCLLNPSAARLSDREAEPNERIKPNP